MATDIPPAALTPRAVLPQHLGARLRQHVHGRLFGDDPCAAAGLPRDRARGFDADGGPHRRRRRSDGQDHQDLLGRALGLAGKRKLLAAVGYGLAAFTKPVFPLATSVGWLVAARFVDRIGKGIRGAPRDALVADIAPARPARRELRTASVARHRRRLHRAVAAIAIMAVSADDFRLVFWMAVMPAFISLASSSFAVQEPASHQGGPQEAAADASRSERRSGPRSGRWWRSRPC